MKSTFVKTVLVTAMLGFSAPAFAAAIPADTEAQIRATLTEQGYEVRKIVMEDGNFEAYTLKDGKKYEVYMDAQLHVVSTKEAD
jgi:hypothetical protein